MAKAVKRARFAINVDSGAVVFRSESTDALPTLWKLIDDETATAIVKKKVSATVVIEAIQKAIVRDEGFSWKEYDIKRKEDLRRWNVSEHDMIPDADNPNGDGEPEQEDKDVLSLKELGLGGDEKPNKTRGRANDIQRAESPSKDDGEAVADGGVNL